MNTVNDVLQVLAVHAKPGRQSLIFIQLYHQLADKSIDTKQLAVGGKDGITVTTDGFSLFAVASTIKPSGSDVPKTGESNVAANIAMLLAMLSMVSFVGVYAKNKAEQY